MALARHTDRRSSSPSDWPRRLQVVVEVPRGGRLKWGSDGRLKYVSPLACPFNYGSAPAILAPDGDPIDVVVLGPRLPRGHEVKLDVVGRVRFTDAGAVDDKWICSAGPLDPADLARLVRFFRFYAAVKRVMYRLRGRRGRTCFGGVERFDQPTRNAHAPHVLG